MNPGEPPSLVAGMATDDHTDPSMLNEPTNGTQLTEPGQGHMVPRPAKRARPAKADFPEASAPQQAIAVPRPTDQLQQLMNQRQQMFMDSPTAKSGLFEVINKDPEAAASGLITQCGGDYLGKTVLLRFACKLLGLIQNGLQDTPAVAGITIPPHVGAAAHSMQSMAVAEKMRALHHPNPAQSFPQSQAVTDPRLLAATAGLEGNKTNPTAVTFDGDGGAKPRVTATAVTSTAIGPTFEPTTDRNAAPSLQGANLLLQNKPGGLRYELKRFPYTGPRSIGKGIVNWLGTNFGTTKWLNPALPQKHQKPLLTVIRSSDAKGCAADAAGMIFTNSCTKSSPTTDEDGQASNWYTFDFKGLLLLPTHYTLRHGWKPGKFCLLNWKLEGSATGKKGSWLTLCNHTDDHTLATSPTNSNTWPLTHGPQNYPWVRFLRVAMTGPNGHGSYTMCLSGFEVYGICVHICQ